MQLVRKANEEELLADETDKEQAEKDQEQKENELLLGMLYALLLLRPMVVEYKVVAYIPWDKFRSALSGAVSTCLLIHDIGAKSVVKPYAYDPLNPETIRQQQAYRDQFIAEYEAETRKAMQYAFMWAKLRGFDDSQLTLLMSKVSGLNTVQMGAILRQYDSRKEAGVKDKALDKMLDDTAKKMLQERAKMTAQSEGWRLFQLGQFSAMQQIEQKYGVEVFKDWRVTNDERLCKFCMAIPALNAKPIPLRQPFVTTKGPVMFAPSHPLCRCYHNWVIQKRGAF